MKNLILSTMLVGALLAPEMALAWGPEGHTVVGDIAEHYLTQRAKRQVHKILKENRLGDFEISSWPDNIRRTPEYAERYPGNGSWHYIDFDTWLRYDENFELKPPPDGQNVVDQITRWQKALMSKDLNAEQRLDALRFLVHFVGDLHQPLHCAFRLGDMGGNMIPVNSFTGRNYSFGPETPMDYPPSIHSTWDEYLVLEMIGRQRRPTFAKTLINDISPEQLHWWSQGAPLDWATDSYWRARKQAYRWANGENLPYTWSRPGMDLTSENYIDARVPIAREQLQKAGVRLAHLLNEALDPGYTAPAKPASKVVKEAAAP